MANPCDASYSVLLVSCLIIYALGLLDSLHRLHTAFRSSPSLLNQLNNKVYVTVKPRICH